MELKIVSYVYIDVDAIWETMLNKGSTLEWAIDDYVSGLDDCDYYAIGNEELEKIKNFMLTNKK